MRTLLRSLQIAAPLVLLAVFLFTSPEGASVFLLVLVYVCVVISVSGLLTVAAFMMNKRLPFRKIAVYSLVITGLLALNSIERLSIAELVLVGTVMALLSVAYTKQYVDIP